MQGRQRNAANRLLELLVLLHWGRVARTADCKAQMPVPAAVLLIGSFPDAFPLLLEGTHSCCNGCALRMRVHSVHTVIHTYIIGQLVKDQAKLLAYNPGPALFLHL